MNDELHAGDVLHATARGVVGAMAMTGLRTFTVSIGLIDETPPQAIARQRARGLLRRVPRKRRLAVIQTLHFAVGATGGATFAGLPESVRQRAWAGPVYGLLMWAGYETAIAPVLGLSHSGRARPVEHVVLAADHALYGFVLSEMRRRPQH